MISVENLSIRLGDFALDGVSFEIPTGEYGVLMGRTGCGKTTVLEAVCGLRQVEGGTIRLSGEDVTHVKAARRGIGFVPQDGALFSSMSVRAHLAFGLVIRKWDASAVDRRVDELAEMLGIAQLLDRGPVGLSGGEQQRVALGRALASHPRVLCLDEPLSALDESTRDEMCALLETVQKETGVTTLHITHGHSEARRLADRVLIMEDGAVREDDLPARGSGRRREV